MFIVLRCYGFAATSQLPAVLAECLQPGDKGLFLPAKSLPVDTHQFVFFHQKIHGIGQRDTGIDMFLYNTFLTERRVV
jgi:hypothetical protein